MDKFDASKRGVFPVVQKQKSMRRVEMEVALAVVLAVAFCTFLCWCVNR